MATQTQVVDQWPKRERFRQLADMERARLGMDASTYWTFLAAKTNKTPRTIRSYHTDRNQVPSAALVADLEAHFGVHYTELERPNAAQRRQMARDAFPPAEPASVPQQRQPRQVVLPPPMPDNAERLVILRELTEKLQGLDVVHLRFVNMLLEPYWGLFGIRKA